MDMPTLPLELLLNRWEQEVRPIEPSTQILIQEILHNYGRSWMLQGKLDELRKAIGPVLVRNEEEQVLFRKIFNEEFVPAVRAYQPDFSAPSDEAPEKEDEGDEELHQMVRQNRVWAYAFMILVLVLARFAFFNSQLPETNFGDFPNTQQNKFNAEQDLVDQSNPASRKVLIGAIDGIAMSRLTPDACARLPLDLQMSVFPGYAPLDIRRKAKISTKTAFKAPYFADISISRTQSDPFAQDKGNPKNQNSLFKGQLNGTFDKAGIYAFNLDTRVYHQDGENFTPISERSQEKVLFVPAFNPDAQEYRNFHLGIMTDQQNWMKIKVFGLLALLFLFTEGGLNLWKNRKRKLAFRMEFDGNDKGPYEIPFDEVDKKLRVDPNIADLAVQLSLRRKSHLQKLNVPETIRKTVAAAGMPQLVYQTQFKAPEYIALMEDDGKLPIYLEFVRQLSKQDVPIKSFVYDIEKGVVYDTKHPEGIRLNKLNYILPHSQLIIFSNGHRLLDPISHEIREEWKEELDLWEDRILITPVLPNLWSRQEEVLAIHFNLLPTYQPENDGKWEIDRSPQILEKKEGTGYDFSKPEDVKAYLGEELFTWLSASMLHNKPRYEVLLAVGHALAAEKEEEFVASGNFILEVPRQEFVSLTNLAKIYSLPWMKEEKVPAGMKKTMLSQLAPQTEALARKAIVEELNKVEAEKGSPAFAEKNTQLAIHQSKLKPDDKLLQRKLRYLWMEDKLEEEEKEGVHFEHAFQRLQMSFPLRQSLLAIAFAGFLGWMGANLYQNQSEQLVSKYLAEDKGSTPTLESWILREGVSPEIAQNGHPFSYFEEIPKSIERGEIQEALDQIFELKKMLPSYTFKGNPEIMLLLDWYEALAVLKTDNLEKTRMILSRIEASGNRYFQQRAFLLRWDLQKPWYQNSLPVEKYLSPGQK